MTDGDLIVTVPVDVMSTDFREYLKTTYNYVADDWADEDAFIADWGRQVMVRGVTPDLKAFFEAAAAAGVQTSWAAAKALIAAASPNLGWPGWTAQRTTGAWEVMVTNNFPDGILAGSADPGEAKAYLFTDYPAPLSGSIRIDFAPTALTSEVRVYCLANYLTSWSVDLFGYYLEADLTNDKIGLWKVVDNVATKITDATVSGFTYAANTWYSVRFGYICTPGVSAQLTGTIWEKGTGEPATPDFDETDTTADLLVAGQIALEDSQPDLVYFDNFVME